MQVVYVATSFFLIEAVVLLVIAVVPSVSSGAREG